MKHLIILTSLRLNMEGRLQKNNELQQRKCNLTMKRLTQARLATTFVIKRWSKSLSHLPSRTILASLSLVKVKLQIMHLSMHCRISLSRKTHYPNSPLNQPSKKTSNQCQITGKRVKMRNLKRRGRLSYTVTSQSLVLTKWWLTLLQTTIFQMDVSMASLWDLKQSWWIRGSEWQHNLTRSQSNWSTNQ